MGKAKHVFVRIYLHILFTLFFFTFGLSLLLLLPLYKYAFAPQAKLNELSFFPVWAHIYKMIWRSLTDKSYRVMFSSRFVSPPVLHNDLSRVRVRESWQGSRRKANKMPYA
jgi:hypothetical protein